MPAASLHLSTRCTYQLGVCTAHVLLYCLQWHGCTAWDHVVACAPHLVGLIQGGTCPMVPMEQLFPMTNITNDIYLDLCRRCLRVGPAFMAPCPCFPRL